MKLPTQVITMPTPNSMKKISLPNPPNVDLSTVSKLPLQILGLTTLDSDIETCKPSHHTIPRN
jgi:hypothetical protein